MHSIALVFAGLAASLHILFFLLESVLFSRPAVQKRFGVAAGHADAVRPWALNQGFYNLFLALAVFVGIGLTLSASAAAGGAMIVTGCAVMLGAGIVLAVSDTRLLRAALIQGLPPLLATALLIAG